MVIYWVNSLYDTNLSGMKDQWFTQMISNLRLVVDPEFYPLPMVVTSRYYF